ncbi:PepSY domain-containing protein [Terrihabitans rhizophilus]|uniref:PepSY domain-containing protein n=1 Tax=Terrihabitans rhizophilus TaxID=3092662 RepID=A0ABU4RQ96_9HYPH|nr:PepSY domain-containing protein [Terrihabitans sp. PJ23]MDX6806274.1 PepSY domain-containing protein [Terrihabitans sp. PJ23]
MMTLKAGLALAALAAFSLPALANDDAQGSREGWMSAGAVSSKLEAQGYTRITEIEADDGVYEVDATAPEGHRVDLKVNPTTAEILRSERDDD